MTLDKIINATKNYFVDSTGALLTTTPLYAAMETLIVGMSVDVSLEARLKLAGMQYCGLGILYARGRDLSRKVFGIKKENKELKKIIHDSAYTFAFNFPFGNLLYFISGADPEHMLKGAISACFLGLVTGPIAGYSIDTFRDFTGTRDSERLPDFIKRVGKHKKKALAAGLILTTILTTAGIYSLKNYTSNYETNSEMQGKK